MKRRERKRRKRCTRCNGTGTIPTGTGRWITCGPCGGAGYMEREPFPGQEVKDVIRWALLPSAVLAAILYLVLRGLFG